MGRKLRYLPEGGALVEVTCRTLQGRLLLRPDPELNDIAAGILGRSQRLYPVDIVGYVVMSNHYHILVWAQDAERLAHSIAKGLAGAKLSGPSRKISGISSRVRAPKGSGQDALAEAVIEDLIRSLERQN